MSKKKTRIPDWVSFQLCYLLSCASPQTKIATTAAIIVPSAVALITLTPWAAIPISAGSLATAYYAPIHEKKIYAGMVVVLSSIALAFSALTKTAVDYVTPLPKSAINTLDNACWVAGKEISISANGENYKFKIDKITSVATISGITESAESTVTLPGRSFWTGSPITYSKGFTSSQRAKILTCSR